MRPIGRLGPRTDTETKELRQDEFDVSRQKRSVRPMVA